MSRNSRNKRRRWRTIAARGKGNLFSAISNKVATAKVPVTRSNVPIVDDRIAVRLYAPIRQAIWLFVPPAERSITARFGPAVAWRKAHRLDKNALGHDDGVDKVRGGYNLLVFEKDDSWFEAAVLREAIVLASRRERPGIPLPTPEAIEEMRTLLPTLDEFLGLDAVERLAGLVNL